MSRSRFFVLPLLLAMSVAALSGCGRRGPLEAPPDASMPSPAQTGVVDPAPDGKSTRPSLARDTSGQDSLGREQLLAPATPVAVPKTPFILDPLL